MAQWHASSWVLLILLAYERETTFYFVKIIATMACRLLTAAAQLMLIAMILAVVLLLVGAGTLVVFHMCIVGRACRRGLSTIGRGEWCKDEEGKGLSPEDLGRLPCYDFNKGGRGNWCFSCAVCLESFRIGERCRLLQPCRHSFHAQCVDSWLMKSAVCPICRGVVSGSCKDAFCSDSDASTSE